MIWITALSSVHSFLYRRISVVTHHRDAHSLVLRNRRLSETETVIAQPVYSKHTPLHTYGRTKAPTVDVKLLSPAGDSHLPCRNIYFSAFSFLPASSEHFLLLLSPGILKRTSILTPLSVQNLFILLQISRNSKKKNWCLRRVKL